MVEPMEIAIREGFMDFRMRLRPSKIRFLPHRLRFPVAFGNPSLSIHGCGQRKHRQGRGELDAAARAVAQIVHDGEDQNASIEAVEAIVNFSSRSRTVEHATLLDRFYEGVLTLVDSRVAHPAPQSDLSSAESEARPIDSHLFISK